MEQLQKQWKKYEKALEEEPIKTKALTAAALTGLSDVIAQRLQKCESWDAVRTLKMALLGLLWSGQSVHFWQKFMNTKLFKGQKPTTELAVKRTIVDQLVFGPTNNIVMMIWLAVVVNGNGFSKALDGIKANYWAIQKNGWSYWSFVSMVSNSFVPVPKRALFANIAGLIWSIYLNSSFKK